MINLKLHGAIMSWTIVPKMIQVIAMISALLALQIIDSYNISGPSPTNDTGDSYTIRHNWVRNVIRDKL